MSQLHPVCHVTGHKAELSLLCLSLVLAWFLKAVSTW